MSDREAITLDPAVARGRMARRATRIAKCISELDTAIKDKDLEAVEMGWIQDMNDTIATNREYYNKLAEAVADQEVNEDQIAKDEDTVDAYHKSVQEAFQLCTLCNSMKNVHNAVQELEENIAKIESFYDAEPSKNYNANLKTLGRYQDTLMVALGASTLGKTHPLRLEASKTMDKIISCRQRR